MVPGQFVTVFAKSPIWNSVPARIRPIEDTASTSINSIRADFGTQPTQNLIRHGITNLARDPLDRHTVSHARTRIASDVQDDDTVVHGGSASTSALATQR